MIRFLKYLKDRLVYFRSNLHYRLRNIFPTKLISGIRLTVTDDEVLSRELVMSILQGGYENLENRVIRNNLLPSERVLELGTGVGFNAIAAAMINGGKVLTYELNRGLNSVIARNQALNKVQFEIRNSMLVCNQNTSATTDFFVSKNACASSIFMENIPNFELKEKLQVASESFEEIISSWKPDFLVVDIEGGEKDLFSCPEVLTRSTVQKILVEIHADIIGIKEAQELVSNISSAGFEMIPGQCHDEVFYFRRILR